MLPQNDSSVREMTVPSAYAPEAAENTGAGGSSSPSPQAVKTSGANRAIKTIADNNVFFLNFIFFLFSNLAFILL
jgi:hypothetical protein